MSGEFEIEKNLPEIENVSINDIKLAAKQLWQILLDHLSGYDNKEIEFIELAFLFMVERHGEQRRKSGHLYIIHPVSATLILLDLKPDKETIAAMLLHDVPEDTYENPEVGISEIAATFSTETAFLVSGITKLGTLKYRGEERYVENLRKMFVAMSKDIRVIFIKLSDRIHNLMTLDALPEDKAKRIALESLEIYAPLSERLGISNFRGRIEDLAFPYVYPDEYAKFRQQNYLKLEERNLKVVDFVSRTKDILDQSGIKYYHVVGRAKKFYSIYRKMLDKNIKLEDIYDLIALRVVTDSISNCYSLMSLLHDHFEVIEDKTKDYIKNPKENGYQSIHMTVRDKNEGSVFEYQIRTKRMHAYAEYGIASHWSYKAKKKKSNEIVHNLMSQESMQWVNRLFEVSQKKMSNEAYLKHIKLNLFPDRIFVFTPKNDVIDLPKGSSAVDFAFQIHEFIGSHATGAKINGKMSKLNTVLQNGDTVEIITGKNQRPSPDWLNWVQTRTATKQIRSMLRKIGIKVN